MPLNPTVIHDDLGRYVITDNANLVRQLRCSYCGQSPRYIARPVRLTLPYGIRPEATIAAQAIFDNDPQQPKYRIRLLSLGINCGCYAKFHRQVAHIQERMNQSAKNKHRSPS